MRLQANDDVEKAAADLEMISPAETVSNSTGHQDLPVMPDQDRKQHGLDLKCFSYGLSSRCLSKSPEPTAVHCILFDQTAMVQSRR